MWTRIYTGLLGFYGPMVCDMCGDPILSAILPTLYGCLVLKCCSDAEPISTHSSGASANRLS
jgi:hypothetical protein